MSDALLPNDALDAALREFAALVERVRPFISLPCVCNHSTIEAEEESLAHCTPCHVNSIFDETLDHARGVVNFLEGMADRHPSEPVRVEREVSRKTNVINFHPVGRKPQPEATWKP